MWQQREAISTTPRSKTRPVIAGTEPTTDATGGRTLTKLFSENFVPIGERNPLEVWPGAQRRTLVWGPRTMLAEIRMKAGTVVSPHYHPHVEEVAYVAAGRVQISVKGQPFILQAGDAFMVPPGIEHSNTVLEDAVIIDCFSPPREEWKP